MKKSKILIAIIILASLLSVKAFCQQSKVLTEGDINITYPASLASQAKIVMQTIKPDLTQALGIKRQFISIVSDTDTLSKEISNLLGAQEKQIAMKKRLDDHKINAEALIYCFSNIHLIKTSDAIATSGVDAGIVQIRYNKTAKDFNMTINTAQVDQSTLKRSFMPVFVNNDGKIRAQDKLKVMVAQLVGTSKALAIAPIHDTVNYTLAQELHVYYPFIRWFDEGVSAWVTKRVVLERNPQMKTLLDDMYAVSDSSKKLRNKVNLLSWPQSAFQIKEVPFFNVAMEAANTQYSLELISNTLLSNGDKLLPKIMLQIKNDSQTDNDRISEVISNVTSKPFKPELMKYVPADVKKGMQSDGYNKYMAEAEKFAKDKKWNQTAGSISNALEIQPENINARLNLARAYREIGNRSAGEMQIFLVYNLLKPGSNAGSMFEPGIESNYVVAKLALMLGKIDEAKYFLQAILEANPNHEDAKILNDQVKAYESKQN